MAVNDPTSTDNPTSPKVKAMILWGVLVPAVIAGLSYLISWIATDDGQAWLKALPDWLQIVLAVLVAIAAAAVAAWKTLDPLRQEALARRRLDRIR